MTQSNSIQRENMAYLNKEDRINVSFFNELTGLDEITTKIVNAKIEDIKDQAENKLAQLMIMHDLINQKLNAYNKMIPKNYSLIDMNIVDVIQSFPHICDDT